jgi:hypothetical protein
LVTIPVRHLSEIRARPRQEQEQAESTQGSSPDIRLVGQFLLKLYRELLDQLGSETLPRFEAIGVR